MEGRVRRAARGAAARRARMRAIDVLTLGAVALVVLLVSLPRLEDLAIRENEGDAARLARRLTALAKGAGEVPPSVEALLARDTELDRRLEDVEFLEEGRLLRRHGYLFEVLPAVDGGGWTLRAWPWEWGRTGRVVFVASAAAGLRGHPNAEALWAGPQAPPPRRPSGEGWRGVRAR